MSDVFDIILLLALPASGKSETRKFIAKQNADAKKNIFHLGTNAQMDDFPYVHLMHLIDIELKKQGYDYIFYHDPNANFKESVTWGVLTLMLNQDYDMLIKKAAPMDTDMYGIFNRIDNARIELGEQPFFYKDGKCLYDEEKLAAVAEALKDDYKTMDEERKRQAPETVEGSTLIVEFARGGADGLTPPLKWGYEKNLALLSPDILERAAILYVWVTPEESRRKNREREDPNDPGSIIAHCVPDVVMYNEYGCDDMESLIEKSDRPGYIKVERPEKTYYVPIARVDNRDDKTSFVRQEPWDPEKEKALYTLLSEGFIDLWKRYKA
ncbi:MAG: hypothetical protein MJ234_05765 [bacterium]|nr:hypothetical protein [bacterium]